MAVGWHRSLCHLGSSVLGFFRHLSFFLSVFSFSCYLQYYLVHAPFLFYHILYYFILSYDCFMYYIVAYHLGNSSFFFCFSYHLSAVFTVNSLYCCGRVAVKRYLVFAACCCDRFYWVHCGGGGLVPHELHSLTCWRDRQGAMF